MPHLSGQHELTGEEWGFPIPPVTIVGYEDGDRWRREELELRSTLTLREQRSYEK